MAVVAVVDKVEDDDADVVLLFELSDVWNDCWLSGVGVNGSFATCPGKGIRLFSLGLPETDEVPDVVADEMVFLSSCLFSARWAGFFFSYEHHD